MTSRARMTIVFSCLVAGLQGCASTNPTVAPRKPASEPARVEAERLVYVTLKCSGNTPTGAVQNLSFQSPKSGGYTTQVDQKDVVFGFKDNQAVLHLPKDSKTLVIADYLPDEYRKELCYDSKDGAGNPLLHESAPIAFALRDDVVLERKRKGRSCDRQLDWGSLVPNVRYLRHDKYLLTVKTRDGQATIAGSTAIYFDSFKDCRFGD